MAKFNTFSVAALVVCFVATNAQVVFKDETGNPCPVCPSDRSYKPVCGSTGLTYNNLMILKCHSLCLKSEIEVKHAGPCKPTEAQANACLMSCPVTFNLSPVCGTNGKTYDNISALICDSRCLKTDIQKKHDGNCA